MPKTMTKADYEALGRNHAQNAKGPLTCPTMFPRSSQSWQAKAYWLAYDEEMARHTGQKPPGATIAKARLAPGMVRVHPRLGRIVSVLGAAFPKRVKGRSKRPGGWTGAA